MVAALTALRFGGRQLAARQTQAAVLLRATPRQLSPLTACRQCLRSAASRPYRGAAAYRSVHSSAAGGGVTDIQQPLDSFPRRHIGPSQSSAEEMLSVLDPPAKTLDEFVHQVLPADILSAKELGLADPKQTTTKLPRDGLHGGLGESDMIKLFEAYKKDIDTTGRSHIGCGYYGTIVPPVIQRNVLENPIWYTSYTPYQPEISQGRLESLLNFQTLTSDLTGLPVANASVLDEATAAAEAMTMSWAALPANKQKQAGKAFVASHLCHPQTLAVMRSRAQGFGINLIVGDIMADDFKLVKDQGDKLIGVLAQYPDTEGGIYDFQALGNQIHEQGAMFSVATDLLALTVLKAPGEFGADIAFGNSQRFGVPMGFGGPQAAFFACTEKHKRKIPGRIVGVSKDRLGNRALRLALQTREQHIRREKATSNICTAQALLANMSAFYAVYHGPKGLKAIAERTMSLTALLKAKLIALGFNVPTRGNAGGEGVAFDTLVIETSSQAEADSLMEAALASSLYLRRVGSSKVGVSLDETMGLNDVEKLLSVFVKFSPYKGAEAIDLSKDVQPVEIPDSVKRTSSYLTHPVFNSHHSETEMLRYIQHLGSKDLSLAHSMISLGSCTMKLNATTEMLPITWPEFSSVHPFTPAPAVKGYIDMIEDLEKQLANITGMAEVTIQPNSGAQGEFAGLKAIKKYHDSNGDPGKRNICLIPVSAHGTNPASAAMAGMRVVPVKCDTATGNLDVADLRAKCEKHKDELGAIMITYPSTYGVFEPSIKEVCQVVHQYGGQVYMDGANMNAQIGLCSPGEIGADVCHLNLHKTFCIPHGGGGPGVGPIGVAEHLRPFLPSHPLNDHLLAKRPASVDSPPISAAPFGSASILPITFAYINMMGARGLTHATKITLLNANYILSRLKPHFPILYTNANGRCAHEFILDVRQFKASAGIEAIDIAKRLQDYGFHSPTMSFPVANTLMIEPTESESKAELDRFCDALISIRGEIAAIERGEQPKEKNILKLAPHTQRDLLTAEWDRPYTREAAAYPLPWLLEKKFWPTVARVDDAFGDQNLFCTCGPVEDATN
ncbi:glycine dehydrogenase [Trichophyton rubrum D6]|nr:glycine dehydrogenase [Trichophyton rubrum MR850]EZF43744.1 glycine dehydrogenase [Trichophyton rubrum CBS 100081]EZF54337.1 glycine dehydrogenase [Trichophyton rubrum CBS 288.86]EZF65028.1 glycine dehydrogenase [Trichophyton rubrum CBS 289.86]EZF75605.1 glycine dehydrogenase [Trichophyton soudanense CBS 452.61]EZF86235.1 glycine dehydrogenase [Trichophyton rubrum MR1448]EZF96963.1 glycine dehydrogenase [Trichophyton rubrum MR1459]EZG18642.1 glycine dehydrogenase [Trichophyton rubrum CBS 